MYYIHFFYLPALIIIALVSLWAILSDAWHDNMVQRIGLAMICFGAVFRIYTLWAWASDLTIPRLFLLYGMAIFALGSVWKIWRNRNRRNYGRRITDV